VYRGVSVHPREAGAGRRSTLLLTACLSLAVASACVTSSTTPPGSDAAASVPSLEPTTAERHLASPTAPSPILTDAPLRAPTPAATIPPPGTSLPALTPRPAPTARTTTPAPAPATPSPEPGTAVAERPPSPEARTVPRTFDRALTRRISRVVERSRAAARVPGLAVAIRLPGGETWTAVKGFAELVPDRPLTEDTVFAIASVTKTFVAALILQLAEEGRLSLDDLLATHLPDAPRADRVTVRQLLGHRSGIHNYFENPRYNREVFADPSRRWTYEEILGFVRAPYCQPDACYHYSNTNYVLLGRIAEVVTGEPLSALLRARFLEPLGLERTVYQPDEPTPSDAAHGHWAYSGGYTDHTGAQTVIPSLSTASVAGAAGAMASTAGDLATWAAALYGGEILAPGSLREMIDVLPPDGYGLGARREVFHGHVAYGHRGGIRGFESSMWYFPRHDVAIALVSNRGLWVTDVPLMRVVQTIMGPWPAPEASPSPSPSSPAATTAEP
jgi:D-alanyl-D-alanine carboxypeptidase